MERSPGCLIFRKALRDRSSVRQRCCYKNCYYKTILNMSNENPNNTSQWRNKLDELERLPGYSFNGDAAWDKLYGRLRGSTKSKKISWYWIAAAACVLFTLMITLLNFHKSISGPPDKETAVKQGKEINKPTLKTGEANKEIEGGRELINDEITSAPRKHTQRKRRVVATG